LVAVSIAFLLGLITTHALRLAWVFDQGLFDDRGYECMIFGVIGLLGLVLPKKLMFLLKNLLHLWYLLSKAGATVIIIFVKFFLRWCILFIRCAQVLAAQLKRIKTEPDETGPVVCASGGCMSGVCKA